MGGTSEGQNPIVIDLRTLHTFSLFVPQGPVHGRHLMRPIPYVS